MQLISKRQIVEDDWQIIEDGTNVDHLPNGKIIVSLSYWVDHQDRLTQRAEPLGIKLNPDDDVGDIGGLLPRFALVVLQFPTFRDGRAYSQARSLRQHYSYQGDIRATGNVLRDQLMYMERVGFSSFEVDKKQNIHDALKAFDEIKVKYQASTDEPLPLYKRRSA